MPFPTLVLLLQFASHLKSLTTFCKANSNFLKIIWNSYLVIDKLKTLQDT